MKFKVLNTIFLIFLLFFVLIKIDQVNTINDISKINRIEIYDKKNNLIYTSNNLHEGSYVEYEEIPSIIKEIFIYSEDKRFFNHSGFDIYRIFSSLINSSSSGASTITQQFIKNLYFNNERTYERKIKELYLSIRLERIYSKEDILEGYLNTLYFGHNIYGINDAGYFFFNKALSDLSISDICVLTNIIKNPSNFSPIYNLNTAILKRNTLLKNLYNAKIITKLELSKALSEEIIITSTRKLIYNDAILYYKDIVLKELKKLDISVDFNQTIKIYTNYDTELNNLILSKIKASSLKSIPSAIVVDKEGYYISAIGGYDYYSSSFNNGLYGNRQIASTVKPLLYYYALSKGYSPLTYIDSTKSSFTINKETYSFTNYGNIYEDKPISMGYALATSDNMYALKLHTILKLEGISKMLLKYNIKSKKDIQQALGNVSMSLNDLLGIYYSFQSLGYKTSFSAIKEVIINKKKYYTHYFNYKAILNSSLCYILNELMTFMFDKKLNHLTSATGGSIGGYLNNKCAGKSGLSDYDSYMVGFNPSFLIGTWVGMENNDLLNNAYDKAFPKQLFKEIFNYLVQDKEYYWYETPKNVYKKEVPLIKGNNDYLKTVYFINN